MFFLYVISENMFVNQNIADDAQYILTINILQYILERGEWSFKSVGGIFSVMNVDNNLE